MILYGDHKEPEMKYEGLARATFEDCEKWGDPFGIAAQEFYGNLAPIPNNKGKQGLSKVLVKLILDCKDQKLRKQLKILEEKIWNSDNEVQIIDIIDKSIAIANTFK